MRCETLENAGKFFLSCYCRNENFDLPLQSFLLTRKRYTARHNKPRGSAGGSAGAGDTETLFEMMQ
jgi:hypothetical protein